MRNRHRSALSQNTPPSARKIAGFLWVAGLAFLSYAGLIVATSGPAESQMPVVGHSVLPEDTAPGIPDAIPDGREADALRGWASWYGPGFHGNPTASGEPFDMHGLTAAHRTLPLGSHVKVRNLKNDKAIVVRINDRGPYKHNRMLDLSYGAARELEVFPVGSALVEVTPL
jgi:rare lipoprotein A (peptidoglycan hydrolase)